MSLVKSHGRDFFFKYFGFDGAQKTLEKRTFLYKSPTFFNDPFDSQITLQPGISEEEMKNIFFETIADAVLDRSPNPRLGLTEAVLATMPLHLNRKGLYNIKDVLLANLSPDYFTRALQIAAKEQSKYFQENFVFCVTEDHDNLLMWSHYADEHQGAVFKIKCIEEKQSLLCASLKVEYKNKYPILGDNNDWINLIKHGQFPDLTRTYHELILTKSTDWYYENEWRMIFPRPEDSGKKIVYLGFHQEEIECVFLGCRMSEENKSQLINLTTSKYPSAKIFQARRSKTEFRLHFDEIN
ncbi:hypothetical protein D3C87_253160 [compost metagenome]